MVWGLRTQASRSTGVSPYFLVYSSEAILPTDITFRAPRVENYDEEQATTVRTESVDSVTSRLYKVGPAYIWQLF